jgi:cation transport protein ChaC
MPTLARSDLEQDRVRVAVRAAGFGHLLLSDDALQASLDGALARHTPEAPVWVFGYGSLVWHPMIRFEERRDAVVHGVHRGFCLRSFINRGSPDRPGLVLALDRGGSCRGVVYRIPADGLHAELSLLWRREMIMGTYVPRWLWADTAAGRVRALAFVVNRAMAATYAGRLADEEILRIAASARGHYGSCADYLLETAAALEDAGLGDRHLSRLARALRQLLDPRPAAAALSARTGAMGPRKP